MKTRILAAAAAMLAAAAASAAATDGTTNVLVFSRTLGYRHASITNGIGAIRALGAQHGFNVEATEDSSVFARTNLERFQAVVFLSVTGDVLNSEQETAFKDYVLGGGGFVGIHGAIFGPQACEDKWAWYGEMFCCKFTNHSAVVPAMVLTEDAAHPSTTALPSRWRRSDEWYNYTGTPRSCAHVLATVDESTYQGGAVGEDHPITWCRLMGKGRMWYTAMGHTESSFSEPLFLQHLLGGIRVAAGLAPGNFSVGSKEFLPSPPPGKEWRLSWDDEFDGARLDETKWNRLGDWKRRDGYWTKEDAYLSGKGTLLLRTRKDGERYTCGAVNTQGKFDHAFGYYVARCRMPKQPGHWPAFWMMCPGVNHVGEEGREGTEIDIVEIPWRDGKITMNLHWDGYGKEHKKAGTSTKMPELTEGFHNYGLLWTSEEYVFYVDGKEVWRSRAGGVSQVPEYLKLTEEIGDWAGDISHAKLPDFFEVDYVRVYDLGP